MFCPTKSDLTGQTLSIARSFCHAVICQGMKRALKFKKPRTCSRPPRSRSPSSRRLRVLTTSRPSPAASRAYTDAHRSTTVTGRAHDRSKQVFRPDRGSLAFMAFIKKFTAAALRTSGSAHAKFIFPALNVDRQYAKMYVNQLSLPETVSTKPRPYR